MVNFKQKFGLPIGLKSTIKKKVIYTFVLLLFSICLISGFNLFMAWNIQKNTDAMFLKELPVSRLASETSKQLYKTRLVSVEAYSSDDFEKLMIKYEAENDILKKKVSAFPKNYSDGQDNKDTKQMDIENIEKYNAGVKKVFDDLMLGHKEINKIREQELEEKKDIEQAMLNIVKDSKAQEAMLKGILTIYIVCSDYLRETKWANNNYNDVQKRIEYEIDKLRILRLIDNRVRQIYVIAQSIVNLHNKYLIKEKEIDDLKESARIKYSYMIEVLNRIETGYQDSVVQSINRIQVIQTKFSVLSVWIMLISLVIVVLMIMLLFSSIVRPIHFMSTYVKKLSDGVIPVIDIKQFNTRDEIGGLAGDFREMCENLEGIISGLKDYSGTISQAVHDSIASSQQLAEGASSQTAYLEETTGMVLELNDSLGRVADLVKSSKEKSNNTLQAAHRGGEAVKGTIKEIHEIKNTSRLAAEGLAGLEVSSKRINSITEMISTIADQTNMLALNAAIEAARAGEAGLGFAVVSDQVAKLAERSARSAKEIEDLISGIKDEIEKVLKVVEKSMMKVDDGVKSAEISGKALEDIINNIRIVNENISDINIISQTEVSVSLKISDAVQNIASTSEQASAMAETSFNQAKGLGDIAHKLQDIVAKFTIEKESRG